jgi:membrane-associated protease RseP (regulator of RpoE activity)
VLFALGRPVAFAGLLVAFLLALMLRAYAIRITARSLGLTEQGEPVSPRPREDIDPFGAVAAAIGGAGWGKTIDVDEVPRFRGRGRAAAVFAAGPVVALIVSQLLLLIFRYAYPQSFALALYRPSDVLRGQFDATLSAQFLLAVAIGLLGFGLLALIPIPPLDGFGLLWSAVRRPGPGMQGYRLWLEGKNLGVVILLACCFFPLGYPLLLIPLDLIGTMFMRVWG